QWNADKIGVTVTDAPNSEMETLYQNVQYATPSTGTVATFDPVGNAIFFQDAAEVVTFAAYAPYASAPEADGSVAFNTFDYNTADTQEKIDFLFASGAKASKSAPTVSFSDQTSAGGSDCSFHHKMAKLVLNVQVSTDDGFEADDILSAGITLNGLKHGGKFNINDGSVTIDEGVSSTFGDWDLVANGNKSYGTGSVTFSQILIPQDLTASPLFLDVTLGGQHFTNSTSIAPNLESGKAYSYTITVKKTELAVSGCTITDWETGDTGTGEAEMTNYINLSDLTGDTTVNADAILTGTTSYKITLAAGVTVTLHNATINRGGIVCNGDAKILLSGTNTVTSSSPGIEVGPSGTTLTIEGAGQLTVKGGYCAAGIGSNSYVTCGDIIINGGTVIVTGGECAAGIGSGWLASCGNITISGVNLSVKAGGSAACVGKGDSATSIGVIKVTNSTVTLDKSVGNAYFDPTPSDITGSTFRDAQTGEVITSF
ncbi:MAG: fimbrillin family protein, partial [Alloprevotella sp.]